METPTGTATVARVTFFSLPIELRDEIYGYVFAIPPPRGLRFEFGTAALLAPYGHFFALRKVSRQLRAETRHHLLRHSRIIFDNLGSRIAFPNYRKYLNRWDTEFSEQRNLLALAAAGDTDVVRKPVEARVRSFLTRCSPAQIQQLHSLEIVELRPFEHVSALYTLLDEFGCPPIHVTLVLVPSIIGTIRFEYYFLDTLKAMLASRWLKGSTHRMSIVLDAGFEGIERWVDVEFPTNPAVRNQLRMQIAGLTDLVVRANGMNDSAVRQ